MSLVKKPSSLVNKPSMRNLYISFLRGLLSPPRPRKQTLTSHTISTMCLMGHIQSSYICNKHLDPISYTALYNSQIASPIYINSSVRFHGGGGCSVRGSRLERAVFHRKREKSKRLRTFRNLIECILIDYDIINQCENLKGNIFISEQTIYIRDR